MIDTRKKKELKKTNGKERRARKNLSVDVCRDNSTTENQLTQKHTGAMWMDVLDLGMRRSL